MRINPISREEAQQTEYPLFAEGDYRYRVLEATETESAKGNAMLKVKITAFDDQGKQMHIYDYLLPEHEKMRFRLRQFMESLALIEVYDSGQLDSQQVVGRSGIVRIGQQPEQNGYPARNVVVRYLETDFKIEAPPITETKKDDEIPF